MVSTHFACTCATIAIFLGAAQQLGAQRPEVRIPSEYSGIRLGNRQLIYFAGFSSGRVQQVVLARTINNASSIIHEVHLEQDLLNMSTLIGMPPTLPRLDLYMGYSAVGPNAISSTFANNRSGSQSLVYSGSFARPVDRPATEKYGSVIKLSRPFNYDPAKGDLLLEWVVPANNPPSWQWNFVGHNDGQGFGSSRLLKGRGFFPAKEWFLTEWTDNTMLQRNGSLNFRVSGFSKSYPSLVLFGGSDQQWGPIKLPLSFSPSGELSIAADILVPASWRSSSSNQYEMRAEIPIPNRPEFEGLELFAQGLCVDPMAAPYGFVLTNALALRIGHANWRQSMVYSRYHTAQQGNVDGGTGYVMRLRGVFP